MPEPIRAPKGVAEYVPPESETFRRARELLTRPLIGAGYSYVELPVFEDKDLFVRGVGEQTDIVGKEMYAFDDRGGRALALRPEGTAGVARAVIQHGLVRAGLPVKLWYIGPFFRAERPQKGRYRQFHQVGGEAIGSDDPALDAEVIAIADAGLRSLGLKEHRLVINSLGDAAERPAYRDQLAAFLKRLDLDPETMRRAELNPLRVLDDKRREVRSLLADAPVLRDFISDRAHAHHQEVLGYLSDLGIAFNEDARLVRGLDYYSRTTFEFVHDGVGAQAAIGGGGRYDGLMAELGGDDLSGVGYALGIDRILLACQEEGVQPPPAPRVDVFLVPVGEVGKRVLVPLLAELRAAGIVADLAYGHRSMKGSMRAADRAGARVAVIVGEREIDKRVAVVKDLVSGTQEEAPTSDAAAFVEAVAVAVGRAVESAS